MFDRLLVILTFALIVMVIAVTAFVIISIPASRVEPLPPYVTSVPAITATPQPQRAVPQPTPTSVPVVRPTTPPLPTYTRTVPPASTSGSSRPTVSSLQFSEIESAYRSMTDAQWHEKWPTYIGVRVLWKGRVASVSESGEVRIYPEALTAGWSVHLGKLPKETYLSLNKDQMVSFEATIKDFTDFLGMRYFTMTDTVLR